MGKNLEICFRDVTRSVFGMMMKTIVMLSSGVVTKTGVLVYHGDVTIMGQNVKASVLCKNVSNFQIFMHEANFPLQKRPTKTRICQE